MIDPSIIDELLQAARDRDQACTFRLQSEIARLPVTKFEQVISTINGMTPPAIQHSKNASSGLPHDLIRPTPANGSYAMQLWSAICFMVDARAELKLLELIASPNFYAALMRSAAETKE